MLICFVSVWVLSINKEYPALSHAWSIVRSPCLSWLGIMLSHASWLMYFIQVLRKLYCPHKKSMRLHPLSLLSFSPSLPLRLRLLWEEGMYEWTALHPHARVCTHSRTAVHIQMPWALGPIHSQISGRVCHLTLSKQRKPRKIELLTRYGNAFKSCHTYQYNTVQIVQAFAPVSLCWIKSRVGKRNNNWFPWFRKFHFVNAESSVPDAGLHTSSHNHQWIAPQTCYLK